MKKITVLLLALFLVSTSCKNDDEETSAVIIDYSKAPTELKGSWKVDFQSLESDPIWIGPNNTNSYIKVSEDNLVSFKDWWTGTTNEKVSYNTFNNGYSIKMPQIEIITKKSVSKPGYTEFNVKYQSIPEKNNILFAKKQ